MYIWGLMMGPNPQSQNKYIIISNIYFNELQLENIWPFLRKQFIFIFVKFGQCKIKLLAFASFFEIWEISEKNILNYY